MSSVDIPSKHLYFQKSGTFRCACRNIVLPTCYTVFAHQGMDGIAESPVEVHILDCFYSTTPDRVVQLCWHEGLNLKVRRSLAGHVRPTLHERLMQYRVWWAKNGAMWDNGLVLCPLSDLVIFTDNYYSKTLVVLVFSACRVDWNNGYMCPTCTVWNWLDYKGQ